MWWKKGNSLFPAAVYELILVSGATPQHAACPSRLLKLHYHELHLSLITQRITLHLPCSIALQGSFFLYLLRTNVAHISSRFSVVMIPFFLFYIFHIKKKINFFFFHHIIPFLMGMATERAFYNENKTLPLISVLDLTYNKKVFHLIPIPVLILTGII